MPEGQSHTGTHSHGSLPICNKSCLYPLSVFAVTASCCFQYCSVAIINLQVNELSQTGCILKDEFSDLMGQQRNPLLIVNPLFPRVAVNFCQQFPNLKDSLLIISILMVAWVCFCFSQYFIFIWKSVIYTRRLEESSFAFEYENKHSHGYHESYEYSSMVTCRPSMQHVSGPEQINS